MYRQGHIVWIEIPDPAGRNPKCRPAIILTSTSELSPSKPLVVVAVTSRFSKPLREDQVELPWSHRKHPVTGLNKPCIAVCDWLVPVQQTQILKIGGIVPNHILEKIAILAARHFGGS